MHVVDWAGWIVAVVVMCIGWLSFHISEESRIFFKRTRDDDKKGHG